MPPAFTDHVALLAAYLDRRGQVVEALERQLLNVQDKETSRSRDRERLERLLYASLHATAGLPRSGPYDALAAALDLFESRTRLDDKAPHAHTWEKLPTPAGERPRFTHSPEWAQQVFADVIDRLRRLAAGEAGLRPGRLIVSDHGLDAPDGTLADSAVSAQEHVVTSDVQWALRTGATAFPKSHLLADRQEGRYLASVEQDGKWFAVSKVLLTDCLARGRDAVIAGVPDTLVDRLRLICPEIAMSEFRSR